MVDHFIPYFVDLSITWEFGRVFVVIVFLFNSLKIIDIFE